MTKDGNVLLNEMVGLFRRLTDLYRPDHNADPYLANSTSHSFFDCTGGDGAGKESLLWFTCPCTYNQPWQDDVTGDGTTSNVLLIGELLKQAELYITEVR